MNQLPPAIFFSLIINTYNLNIHCKHMYPTDTVIVFFGFLYMVLMKTIKDCKIRNNNNLFSVPENSFLSVSAPSKITTQLFWTINGLHKSKVIT